MGVRLRELVVLVAAVALAASEPLNKTKKEGKEGDAFLYQYEDYDAADDQEVLFNEDRPCPRDCICTVSQGYRIAKCNRLEIGTQKFGDDITDLVIEHADPRLPISLDDFIFKKLGLHQVATVKIVNSTIQHVGPNAFHGLHELYAVNLANNKLKSLHPDTFANNKKLLLLTLSNNPELMFPAYDSNETFLNSSSVQELDVSYCNISYVTENTFKNMTGLMYLNLAGNNLANMNPNTFKKLLDLEELDLSDNNIASLPEDIFSENSELATLHILKNPIDSVYGLQISDLLTLNAGQTKIKFIGPSMFNGMTYIANLNLSGNSIQKIHNQAFHKLVELNYLDLSYNDMDFISNTLIKENIELDIFKISNNPLLTQLPENGFECAADQFNIYLFDASHCGLQEISDNALRTFTALSVVNLAGNQLTSISSKVFSVCPKLVEINLSHNLLTTLDVKIFEQNNELGKLILRGNPLKVLSAEIFIHTPLLTWIDMSHSEMTSLWSPAKNNSVSVLKNLTFLNVSHNHITEIKKREVENLTKLRTIDVGNNPLACSVNFENLLSWLNEHKVSPRSVPENAATGSKDAKENEQANSWEYLSNTICGKSPKPVHHTHLVHPVQPLNVASDEEIWERIDKDAEGNFDLKNTLDDGKVSDDSKLVADIKTAGEKEKNLNQYLVDDGKNDISDNNDDMADDDDDADDEEDEEDDEDEDESGEDTDVEDDVELTVKLSDKTTTQPPAQKISQEEPKTEKVQINIKLMDNLYDDLDNEEYQEVSMEHEHGRYDYLWPIAIAVLGALLLLVMIGKIISMMCNRRTQQMRYNSAIIAAMSQSARTKKDCGLVYQQLSEDLTGPATPKLSRYQPLHSVTVNATNMSYESSPFHHQNIVPEHV